MSTLTVLETVWADGAAFKFWPKNAQEPQAYKLGKLFDAFELHCEGIEDLARLLIELQTHPKSFVIRGMVREGAENPIRRAKSGDDAGLMAWDSPLVALDVDSSQPPEGLETFAERCEWVRDQLGGVWKNTQCVAQATSRDGVRGAFRCRLWYWADRGISDEELKARLVGLPVKVDLSVCGAVQPIYTAPPQFESSLDDPWMGGSRLIRLPGNRGELDVWGVPRAVSQVEARVQAVPQMITKPLTQAQLMACEQRMQKILEKIEVCDRDRPEHLLKMSRPVCGWCVNGYSDRDTVTERLLVAFAASYDSETDGGLREAGASVGTVEEGIRIIETAWRYAEEDKSVVLPQRKLTLGQVDASDKTRRKVKKQLAENPEILDVVSLKMTELVDSGAVAEDVAKAELEEALTKGGVSARDAAQRLEKAFAEARQTDKRKAAEWLDGLKMCGEGASEIDCTLANLSRIFSTHPDMKGVAYYDSRAYTTILQKAPPWAAKDDKFPREMNENTDLVGMINWLAGLRMHTKKEASLIKMMCATVEFVNSVDPFLKYLESLEWDGVPRLDTWLVDYAGAEDTPYVRAVGPKVLRAAVARALEPGCKVDTTLILEGRQGAGKSSMVRALMRDSKWFAEGWGGDVLGKEAAQGLLGPVIVEIPELAAFKNREVEAIKRFLSVQSDWYRPSYGKVTAHHPRRCVFIGTTNASQYLHDPTGNRRYWPVEIGECDVEGVARDRDQLWAEAYARTDAWWLTEAEEQLAIPEQEARRQQDPIEEALRAALALPPPGSKPRWPYEDGQIGDGGLVQFLTTKQAFDMLLKSNLRYDPTTKLAIGGALRVMGWRLRQNTVGGRRDRRYYRPS